MKNTPKGFATRAIHHVYDPRKNRSEERRVGKEC